MASKILGIAFTVLFLALTWLLLLVSIHGAESLPYFALAYVIVALVVFWTVYLWVGRRLARHRPAWLLLTGGALVGLAFSLPPLANKSLRPQRAGSGQQ